MFKIAPGDFVSLSAISPKQKSTVGWLA